MIPVYLQAGLTYCFTQQIFKGVLKKDFSLKFIKSCDIEALEKQLVKYLGLRLNSYSILKWVFFKDRKSNMFLKSQQTKILNS